ncbi:transcriptional regulator [Eubacteriales bacterium]|nr:transcriptional regulator [Eubacteriales bacterium]GKH62262.1 transcriptional regulator [Eubacteriales bacterium]
MDNKEIGRRIKIRRQELNMTQGDVAANVGIAISTVGRYEAGQIESIKLPVIEAIARAIRVNPDWLIGKSSTKNKVPDQKEKAPALTKKDERDIAKDMERLRQSLETGDGLMFDGDPLSDEAKESILAAMKMGLEIAKVKNKEKYTPKKYRKETGND